MHHSLLNTSKTFNVYLSVWTVRLDWTGLSHEYELSFIVLFSELFIHFWMPNPQLFYFTTDLYQVLLVQLLYYYFQFFFFFFLLLFECEERQDCRAMTLTQLPF